MARLFAILLAVILSGCKLADVPQPVSGCCNIHGQVVHYKLTIAVDTPEGVKTASAVREATHYKEQSILPDQGGNFYTLSKGEAIAIDLGKRGLLVSLLGGDQEAQQVALSLSNKSNDAAIPFTPRFVRFPNHSSTNVQPIVTVADLNEWPAKPPKSYTLAQAFGPGVHIKSISYQITNDDVTWNLTNELPWLPSRGGNRGYLGGTAEKWNQDPSGTFLTGIDLSRGKYW